MFFLPAKEYKFVYLVIRLGNKYHHSNSFSFNQPFEIMTLKIEKMMCTSGTFVPPVGSTDKRLKGQVFLDNNQAEWYLTDEDSSRPNKISVAHASVWTHFSTKHERSDLIGHMFMTEHNVFLRFLSEMLLQKDLKSYEEISKLFQQVIKLSDSS